MTSAAPRSQPYATLPALPTDFVRQLMWRFAGRPDLQQLIVAAPATGATKRWPASSLGEGARRRSGRRTSNRCSRHLTQAGITGLSAGRGEGNLTAETANLAAALAWFELAWVDGGAAACSSALRLAQEPIAEAGTREQKERYLGHRQSAAEGGKSTIPPRGLLPH